MLNLFLLNSVFKLEWAVFPDVTFSIEFICRSFAAVGVDPAVMGIGPAVAIPAAVKAAGLQVEDIDCFEINEVTF